MSHRRSYITSAFLACILMLVLSLGIAMPAYAREYEMTRTDIDATVGTDGSMEVREDDEDFENAVDIMFKKLEKKDPEHFAVRQYKKFKMAAGKIK